MKSLIELCLRTIVVNNISSISASLDIQDHLKDYELLLIRELRVASTEIIKLHYQKWVLFSAKQVDLLHLYGYKYWAAESYMKLNKLVPCGRLIYFSFIDPYAEYYLHDEPIPDKILNGNPPSLHELNPIGGTDLDLNEYKTLFAYIKADTGNISDMGKRKKLRGYFMHRADRYPIEIIDPYNRNKVTPYLVHCNKV